MGPQLRFIRFGSGVEVHLDRLYSRSLRHAIDLEWYFGPMAEALDWPLGFFSFCAKLEDGEDIVVKYVKSIRTQTKVHDLQRDMDGNVTVQVIVLAAPRVYDDGLCACIFGSCCLLCNVLGDRVCDGCGNGKCCISGDCGHKCCADFVNAVERGVTEHPTHQLLQRCSYHGCRAKWAAMFPWPDREQLHVKGTEIQVGNT